MKLVTEIHPNDLMYDDDVDAYLRVGRTAINSITAVCAHRQFARILDFGCGYGRVARHFRAVFPASKLTVADRIPEAVDFCASRFNAAPIYCDDDPTQLSIRDSFDLIWVGSVFTHIDHPRWYAFLSLFDRLLRQGGLLVFSVAGPFGYRLMMGGDARGLSTAQIARVSQAYELSGFAHVEYLESIRKPSDPEGWGRAFVIPERIVALLDSFKYLHKVAYIERGYGGRQDVVACIKANAQSSLLLENIAR